MFQLKVTSTAAADDSQTYFWVPKELVLPGKLVKQARVEIPGISEDRLGGGDSGYVEGIEKMGKAGVSFNFGGAYEISRLCVWLFEIINDIGPIIRLCC